MADSTLKSERHSARLLGMLDQSCATIEQTNSSNFFTLSFEGIRTVRCQRSFVTQWLNLNLVRLVKTANGVDKIEITHDGKRFLREIKTGDTAEQHRTMASVSISEGRSQEAYLVNAKESPLASLYLIKRKGSAWLADTEFQAGERLRSDFEFSQMGPRVTASWDPTATLSAKGGRRPADTLSERAMGAKQRFNKAIEAVGPELSGVLLDVCCFLKGIEQVEIERQWPRRSAKLLLKAALSSLSRHYNPESISNSSKQMRHWGASDFRPHI